MGMSMHVRAIRPADDKWLKMKAIWDSCQDAGVEPPVEVDDFFAGEQPNPAGVVAATEGSYSKNVPWLRNLAEDDETGFEVDLTKLPDGVKVLQFICSW